MQGLKVVEETGLPVYFGEWVKRRRKELDLTQAELAMRVGCSVPALRKIESGERRPSRQLAGLLAKSLEISPEYHSNFISVARGLINLERLNAPDHVPTVHTTQAPRVVSPPNNLPVTLTPFIGREPELTAIGRLLADPHCRLLTLTGGGGVGKTRLAIEVATRHKDLFPDGTWFVSLAPLNSPSFIVPAIADALDFRFQDPLDPQSQLLNYLHERQALLVLDNVEHLLDGAGLFTKILESSPQVKLLVTSRERMNLLSEWVFEIQGLPVPPDSQDEHFGKFSSVALFLQSAGRIQANFHLQDDERGWVVRICQIMEGMPLGIELAAAWVGVLSCKQIAREIERNIDFLTVSMRDIPERHRSLRATLDHSWNLMSSQEKTILSRLSVFQGSFNRRAAQEICGANLALLSSLKDKSLLRRTDQERYDLHELIHQYAALRLAEDPHDEEQTRDRHAAYFGRRFSEWEQALKGSMQMETISEMAHEIDNLRQAWQRMVKCCDFNFSRNPLIESRLFFGSLFSLSLFYELQARNQEAASLFGEAVEFIKAARDMSGSPEDSRQLDTILGYTTAYLGLHHAYLLNYHQACELLNQALSLLDEIRAKSEKAQAQVILAWIIRTQGQIQKSIVLIEETLAIFQERGEVWWCALALTHLAWAYLSIGKIEKGKELYQEGFRLAEPGNLRLTVPIRNGLAYASYLQNDFAEAERLLQENKAPSIQLGSKRQTALCYLDLGQVALATSRIELAERNFQESVDLLSEFGESHDLALGLLYLGKCLIARQETEGARRKFLQVIQIGQGLNIFHLVYWALVNLARVYLVESHTEKALEMALVLRRYSVESQVVRDDGIRLMEDLNIGQPAQPIETATDLSEGKAIESLLSLI